MANIYTFKRTSFKDLVFRAIVNRYVFAAFTAYFAIAAFFKPKLGFVAIASFLIFLKLVSVRRDLKQRGREISDVLQNFSTFSDEVHIFKSVPIIHNNWAYTVDYIIVTPKGIFTVWEEASEGTFAGHVESDSWKSYEKKRGRTIEKTWYFPVSLLRRQTYYTSEILKSKGIRAWVQGVVYFSKENTKVNGQGKDTVVLVGFDEFSNYIKTYKPRRKLDQAAYKDVIRVIKEHGSRRAKLSKVKL